MNKNIVIATLLFIVLLRLVWIVFLPLSDTTEARYGDMARMMFQSGNWITPWFQPDVPFWGKPPLSIWAQTIAIHIFGLHEFAIRLPSLIFVFGMMVLTFLMAQKVYNSEIAWLSALVLMSAAVSFILSGAILMDPAFAFAFTLTIAGLVLFNPRQIFWKYAVFLGVSIGLLSKGPVIGALLFIPFMVCLSLRYIRRLLFSLPWLTGVLLTLALTLPWYVLAEFNSPGFLQYFIVGEHILRFIEPGWAGDLYGSAHREPIGSIWLMAIKAFLPWSLLVPIAVYLTIKAQRSSTVNTDDTHWQWLFVAAAVSSMVFFTFSRNILWTYILPSIPFLSMLLVGTLYKHIRPNRLLALVVGLSLVIPLISSAAFVHQSTQTHTLSSAYYVLKDYAKLQKNEEQARLYFVGEMPFSANYYSASQIQEVSLEAWLKTSEQQESNNHFFVARHSTFESMQASSVPLVVLSSSKYYVLLKIEAAGN